METRANYALIGLFTLAVVVAGFGFVFWFHRGGGVGERASYQVVFDGPVTGLRTGAPVVFNGVRVGEVTGIALNPADPRQVIGTIQVTRAAPVRADTDVGVEYQGLTGIAALSLKGGSANAPPLQRPDGQPPVLKADLGSTRDVMQSGREVLKRFDDILLENQETFRATMKNLETFTETMARNSERLDRMIASAENVATGFDSMLNGKDGQGGEIRDTVLAARKLVEGLDQRTEETVRSFQNVLDSLNEKTSGTLDTANKFIENLDKRTAEISVGLTRFTGSGLKQWEVLAVDARRALGTIEKAVSNFDRNPTRVIFGSSFDSGPEDKAEAATTPPRRPRRSSAAPK